MDNIQALVIGGTPITIRRSGCVFDLGAPIITTYARELNEAFTSLASRFHDVVLLNAEMLGATPEKVIGQDQPGFTLQPDYHFR